MAKYTEAQIKAMGAKGQAFRNPDGHYSYPIGDEEDLHNAIHAVGRGGASHDAIRAYIIRRAKALGLSSAIPDNWTSSGGNSSSAQRDPQWEQRRRRWAGSLVGQRERRSLALTRGDIEIRALPDGTGGTKFEFNGYAATFYEPFEMWDKWGDQYDEDVWDTAFRETLSRRDLDTPFLVGHNDSDIPMARTRSGTMRLATDTRGLHAHAPGLDGRNDQVRRLASAMERGDIDEMSIGFVCTGQQWSEDWSQRHLTGIDLHRGDVSVVALAANPATRGASMVALPAESLSRRAAAQRAAMNAAAGPDMHAHPHFHDGDADHDHDHDTVSSDAGNWGSRRPAERRGNPVDQDLGDAPDYDVYSGPLPHGPVTGMHSHAHPSYGGDALVNINDDGVPAMTEEQGGSASLALARSRLETRRRQLELLRLGGRNG